MTKTKIEKRVIFRNNWRAGYIEMCKSGSEGGIQRPTLRTKQGVGCLPYFPHGDGQSISGEATTKSGNAQLIRMSVDTISYHYHPARVATVTVTNKASGETLKVYISQGVTSEQNYFAFSPSKFSFGAEGAYDREDTRFSIRSNGDSWTLSSDADWCVFHPYYTSGGPTQESIRYLYFDVKGGWSEGYHPSRTATITVRQNSTGKTLHAYVTQEASTQPEEA